jgi:hypothetical protein
MPKGQYERKSRNQAAEQPLATPAVQAVLDDRMQVQRGPRGRTAVIEQMVGMAFRPHSAPMAGYEYIWEKDGQLFSITVKGETVHPREITSSEYYGSGNQNFVTHMRENTVIATNDPRRKAEIGPDPGPKVFCKSATGDCFTLTPSEFLDLVNENRARAVALAKRNNV